MVDRVVQRDGLSIDVERVRQIHVAAERPPHALRDDRLAVSRRPVQEDRFAGVDGGAKPIEHLVLDDQMREAAAQPLAIDVAPRCLQRLHRCDVGGQRHRRRADVLIGVEILLCAIATEISFPVTSCHTRTRWRRLGTGSSGVPSTSASH